MTDKDKRMQFLGLATVPDHPPLPLFHMSNFEKQLFIVTTIRGMEWHIDTYGQGPAELSAREALQKGEPPAYHYVEGFQGIAQAAIPESVRRRYTGTLIAKKDGTPVAIGAINLGWEAFTGEGVALKAIIKNDQRPLLLDGRIVPASTSLKTPAPTG